MQMSHWEFFFLLTQMECVFSAAAYSHWSALQPVGPRSSSTLAQPSTCGDKSFPRPWLYDSKLTANLILSFFFSFSAKIWVKCPVNSENCTDALLEMLDKCFNENCCLFFKTCFTINLFSWIKNSSLQGFPTLWSHHSLQLCVSKLWKGNYGQCPANLSKLSGRTQGPITQRRIFFKLHISETASKNE